MALQILQNFYKQTVAIAWAVGTGNRYVSGLPTPTAGRLVINPSDSSKREIISYSGVGTDGNGTYITVTARGLGGTTDQAHSVGEPIRMNITAEHYADIQTELDLKAPKASPAFTGVPTTPTPTQADQIATKAYVDLVAGGSATYDQEKIDGTSGEALTAGQVAYFKEADAKWYKADADLVATFNELRLGMVQTTVAGADLSTTILISGLEKNQSSLTPGAKYYLSNTAGAITLTPGTNTVFIGWAKSATQLILSPMNIDAPTADEKNAMAGASGTPADTNRFETENDTSNGATKTGTTIAFVNSNPDTITDSGNGFVTAGFKRGQTITITGSVSNNGTFTIASVTAGTITLITGDSLTAESAGASVTIAVAINEKLARYSSTGQLRVPTTAVAANDAVSKAHLDANATLKAEDYTAGEAITALDAVYPSAANTIKTIIPTTVGTRVAIATAPTSAAYSPMHINLGGGRVLRLAGGDGNSRIAFKAQVRSINAAETDLTNGSEQTIYSSTDVQDYSATLIATDKVLVIYQTTNGGVANGIRTIVLSISGTSISMGTEQVIESLGSTGSNRYGIAKLATDKALICYRKDSDQKPYIQVLTISGTTITTNTPYKVEDTQHSLAEMAQITTDTALLIYHTGSNTTVNAYVITVSGTTPTIGSPNNIYTSSGGTQVDLRMINTTLGIIIFHSGTNQGSVAKLTISGNTVTKGSNLSLSGTYVNTRARAGIQLLGAKRAYVLYRINSNTTLQYAFLDISGATPTSLETNNWSTAAVTGYGCAVGKLKPWLYYLDSEATGANDDFIQPLSTTQVHIGMAPSAIANAASGAVNYRYLTSNNFTGLTAGSRYYVDDNGQPTTESSLTAPSLGVAISTTKMLMQ